ncbi:glycosyltransferase family 4 protein [Proteus penneri]|uniref:glycosyltransferase family 4 protein n=1 Tax=Proteus penneri TaxID=102862 RepID=UPI0028894E8A|nr:glycosyltransferase family 4 protein [Proteus penneri]
MNNFSNNIIFLVGDITEKGGIERVTINLANSLSTFFNVKIISLYKKNRIINFDLKKSINVEYINNYYEVSMYNRHLTNFKGLFFDIKYIIKKRKPLKKLINNNDIVISSDIKTTCLLLGLKKKLKIIAIEHFEYSVASNILNKIRKLTYNKLSAVISLTPEDRDCYTAWLDPKKHFVIPNIIQSPANVLPYENKKNIIVAIGRLTEQKGFDLLLSAWAKIEHNGWQLRIIGDGEDKQKLLDQIQSLEIKDVTLVSYKNDIDSEYQQAKIFILSSRYEGLGMVLLEALSHGLACISFDCPAGPKSILNKNNGLLVKTNDVSSLSQNIDKLINNESLIKKLNEIGPLSINEYKEDSILEKWITLIKNV